MMSINILLITFPSKCICWCKKDRKTERQKERQKDRKTERQKERQKDRKKDRKKERQKERKKITSLIHHLNNVTYL